MLAFLKSDTRYQISKVCVRCESCNDAVLGHELVALVVPLRGAVLRARFPEPLGGHLMVQESEHAGQRRGEERRARRARVLRRRRYMTRSARIPSKSDTGYQISEKRALFRKQAPSKSDIGYQISEKRALFRYIS